MLNTHSTVLFALQHWREHRPDKTAFGFINGNGETHEVLSFATLAELASCYGFHLLQRYQAGDRVALVLPTSADFVIAFYACLWVGIIPIPLSQPSRMNGKEHITKIFANASVAGCITQEKMLTELPPYYEFAGGFKTVSFELPPSAIRGLHFHALAIAPEDDDLAFLQYTSGSTSDPKGVMVSHGNIYANHRMIRNVFAHSDETKQLNWMPLYHDMGLIGHVLHPVCNGHTSYLMDPVTFVQRPLIWLESISNYGITSTGGPNFCYQHCVKRIKPENIKQLNLRSLTVAYNGAEPINPAVLEDFTQLCEPFGFHRDAFLPCFGLAEATLLVAGIRHNQPIAIANFAASELQQGRAVSNESGTLTALPSLGKAAPGIDIRIIAKRVADSVSGAGAMERTVELPPFSIGEIWLSGANVTLGYWHNREATEEHYVTVDDQRYLRTGDLGFVDNDGNLFVTGRQKDLIIIDGKNHYPQDIEFTAQAADALLNENACAAFMLENNRLVIVQELKRQYRRMDDLSLLNDIKDRIKMIVSQTHALAVEDVVFIGSHTLPKTTSGKVKRHLVKHLYEQQSLSPIG